MLMQKFFGSLKSRFTSSLYLLLDCVFQFSLCYFLSFSFFYFLDNYIFLIFIFQNHSEDTLRQELAASIEDKMNYETTAKVSLVYRSRCNLENS